MLTLMSCERRANVAIAQPLGRANLYFVVDKSGSMNTKENRKEVEVTLGTFVDNAQLSDSTLRISIVTFADTVEVVTPLTSHRANLYAGIDAISNDDRASTSGYLKPALSRVEDLVIDSWNEQIDSVSPTPAYIVIITDGLVSDQEDALSMAEVLRINDYMHLMTLSVCKSGECASQYLVQLAGNKESVLTREQMIAFRY